MKKIGAFHVLEDKQGKTPAFYVKSKTKGVTLNEIRSLVEESKKRNESDIRLNLHNNLNNFLQQMVIIQHNGRYRRPHKHPDKEESYQIIIGKMALVFFDSVGRIKSHIILDVHHSFLYRIEKNIWHVSIPLSKIVVLHEIKLGPFIRNRDIVFSSWSPDEKEIEESNKYMNSLMSYLNEHS